MYIICICIYIYIWITPPKITIPSVPLKPHRRQHLQGRHPADLSDRRALRNCHGHGYLNGEMNGNSSMNSWMIFQLETPIERISTKMLVWMVI